MTDFYDGLRWDGWQRDVEPLAAGQGLSLLPPPFTAEGRDLAAVSRAPVPLTELHSIYAEFAEQLSGLADGSTFELKPSD